MFPLPYSYSKEPLFVVKPRSSEAYEGDNVIIFCEVVGDPKPEVVWLRDFLNVSRTDTDTDMCDVSSDSDSSSDACAAWLSQLHLRRQQMWVAFVVSRRFATYVSRCQPTRLNLRNS